MGFEPLPVGAQRPTAPPEPATTERRPAAAPAASTAKDGSDGSKHGGTTVAANPRPFLSTPRGSDHAPRVEDFALPAGDSFWRHLDIRPESATLSENPAFEAELLQKSELGMATLRRAEGTVPKSVRQAAARQLLYTAMFMKTTEDAVQRGVLGLDDIRRHYVFGGDAGLTGPDAIRTEVLARQQVTIDLLELAQRELQSSVVEGFIASSYARLEIVRDGQVSEATFARVRASVDEGGLFNAITSFAAADGKLTAVQTRELASSMRNALLTGACSDQDGNPLPGCVFTAKAPYAQHVARILMADALTASSASHEKIGFWQRLKSTFDLAIAKSLYTSVSNGSLETPADLPRFPAVPDMGKRLDNLAGLSAAIRKGRAVELPRYRELLTSEKTRLTPDCYTCHTTDWVRGAR